MKKDLIKILGLSTFLVIGSGIYGYKTFCNQKNFDVQKYISTLPATAAGNPKDKYLINNKALLESKCYRRDF